MKYKFNIWVEPDSENIIFNNIDVVEAGISFIFWEDYELDINRIPEEVLQRTEFNERNQIDISSLIKLFRSSVKPESSVIDIIFLSSDIYYKDKEYIFAATHIPSKTIVISLCRLSRTYDLGGFTDENTLRTRVFKEILHELGHLLGLDHCNDEKCVMSFSPNLRALDDKLPFFCRVCVDRLKAMGYKVFTSDESIV